MDLMRTHEWLKHQLNLLLEGPFGDMPRSNLIEVRFGRLARRRLGSITMTRDKSVSRITVNGLFRDEMIPEQVVQATLAHELCHYAHGFSSPLPKKYDSPHAGGVIERELKKRDLGPLYDFEKQWTKNHWPKVLELAFPLERRIIKRRSRPSAKGLFRFLFQ